MMAKKKNSFPQESITLDPVSIVKQISVEKGELVADFGCGSGYFVLPVAKIIGEEGKIYAIDILEKRIESIQSLAKINGLYNVVPLRINLEVSGSAEKVIGKEELDKVIISNALFLNEDKEAIILEARKTLKPGGELIIIEWKESGLPMAPAPNMLVHEKEITDFCESNNLLAIRELDAGKYHWGKVFVKK